MSNITNRPLSPVQLIVGEPTPPDFLYHDYISDNIPVVPPASRRTYHGMQRVTLGQGGEWEKVISHVGYSGMCKFLTIAALNDQASAYEFGIRVFFNGASVYFQDRISVPPATTTGLRLIGNMEFFNDEVMGFTHGWAPWYTSFEVEAYKGTDLAGFMVTVASMTHRTTGVA